MLNKNVRTDLTLLPKNVPRDPMRIPLIGTPSKE
jgi:hypothetical protein